LLIVDDGKGKAIPVTGRQGPQCCERSRLPHFLDNRLTNGGEVVRITRLSPFTPRKDSLLEPESTPYHNVIVIIIIIKLNSVLFTCRVNSYKANHKHSTVWIQIITLWIGTSQTTGKHWKENTLIQKSN
jgi:hypothetical protein